MIQILGNYKPELYVYAIKYTVPNVERLKYNIDGSYKGNSGMKSYGFGLRDYHENLVYVQAKIIGITTNFEE